MIIWSQRKRCSKADQKTKHCTNTAVPYLCKWRRWLLADVSPIKAGSVTCAYTVSKRFIRLANPAQLRPPSWKYRYPQCIRMLRNDWPTTSQIKQSSIHNTLLFKLCKSQILYYPSLACSLYKPLVKIQASIPRRWHRPFVVFRLLSTRSTGPYCELVPV